jgi:hypothetical protein
MSTGHLALAMPRVHGTRISYKKKKRKRGGGGLEEAATERAKDSLRNHSDVTGKGKTIYYAGDHENISFSSISK